MKWWMIVLIGVVAFVGMYQIVTSLTADDAPSVRPTFVPSAEPTPAPPMFAYVPPTAEVATPPPPPAPPRKWTSRAVAAANIMGHICLRTAQCQGDEAKEGCVDTGKAILAKLVDDVPQSSDDEIDACIRAIDHESCRALQSANAPETCQDILSP